MGDIDKQYSLNKYRRFAVFFVPRADTALAEFGRSWLGVEDKSPDPRINEFIASPRRYGFHATLKAPMRLRPGISPAELLSEVKKLSQKLKPVVVGFLRLDRLENFLVLKPTSIKNSELDDLAWKCVRDLDHMRAPLSEAERRSKPGLSDDERRNLAKWGNPYVGDQFRFHMTLTSALSEQQLAIATLEIRLRLGRTLDQPVTIDSLCIFGDPGDAGAFKLVQWYDLQR